ncbi:T9SS type A sorting domain-containing protein [Bacteroidales bacterium AH-315-I05]|nr:T9SS type A sorting domain-containing protein [Bacteroidales bacterium AH-315-I05]
MKKLLYLIIIGGVFFDVVAQCAYDNSLYLTWSAPVAVGDSEFSSCVFAGEYNRVTNMVAGNVYRISTCSSNAFDTQLSVFAAGSTVIMAFNDDADVCGLQSELFFNPPVGGDYDILIDEYDCIHNATCADLTVELVFEPRPVITIPIVVHVVYNAAAENISDAQIQSQIDVLNEDFRRTNADFANAPAVFASISADARLEFCLAQRDPSGNPTTGITRTFTSKNEFLPMGTPPDFSIWYSGSGGKDIWNPDDYLNIYVCDLGPSTLAGFAVLPALSTPAIDGVLIDYTVFGAVANNKGRSATHEIGHYFDLHHLWGDDSVVDDCADDNIPDTPKQDLPTSGCPVFPASDSCTADFPGIMFNNFMDYSNDVCRNMFTWAQTLRMDVALFNSRAGLLSSQGCEPVTGIELAGTQENNAVVLYPNPSNGIVEIRHQPSGGGHQHLGVKIYNVLGMLLVEQKITAAPYRFDVSHLAPGSYFAEIRDDKHTEIHQFLKY